MKEMEYTVEAGGPLLPFLLERVRGSRNHVKSLLTRGQVEVDGKKTTRHDHPLTPGQRVAVPLGSAVRAGVRTGRFVGNEVVIEEGLRPGERVVVDGMQKIGQGSKVVLR